MGFKYYSLNFFFCLLFSIYSNAQLPKPLFFLPDTLTTPRPSLLSTETFQRGIFFQHLQQSHGLHGLDDTLGSGACVFDMDNDGDMDLYFVAGSGATRFFGKQHWWSDQPEGQLYTNNGSGYFTLVTIDTGLPKNNWGMGCNSADIDKDGFSDLIITGFGKNWIAYGDGTGSFTTEQLGLLEHWSTAISLHDINNDGLLDIYIGNYLKYQKNTKTLEINTGFSENQSAFSAENFPAQSNELYINNGSRIFRNQAKEFNLQNSDGRTLGVKWLNQNDDDWPDLLIINDTGSESQLYINQQGKNFKRATLERQIDSLNGLRSSTSLTLASDPSNPIDIYSSKLGDPLYLLSNNDKGQKNITWNTLLGEDKLERTGHWGITTADFNGDGLDDVYVGSGLPIPDSDAHRLSQGQPDSVLLQTPEGKLHKKHNDTALSLSTRSVIPVDIDNDGDRDLILTHNNGTAQLKVNNSDPQYWIGLDIKTAHSLRNHYEKIKIHQDSKTKWLFPLDDSFLGKPDHRRTTRLESNDKITVAIHWISGDISEYNDLEPNQFHILEQGQDNRAAKINKDRQALALPFDLAIWQIKLGKIDWQRMLVTFTESNIYNKQVLLEEAHNKDNHSLILAFIEIAQSKNIQLKNTVKIIMEQELEISLPLVFNLLNNSLNCNTLDMLTSWFIEEEAMLLSKQLFISPLIKRLHSEQANIQSCILYALAKSKSLRPTFEIEKLLANSKNINIKKASIYSLGELRRIRSVSVLNNFLRDPLFMNDAKVALNNFNSRHKNTTNSHKKNKNIGLKSIKNSKSIICPRLKFEEFIALSDREMATLLSLCSKNTFTQWIMHNIEKINLNYNKLINNPFLSSDKLKTILKNTHSSKIIGADIVLVGLLDKLNTNIKKEIVLDAMLDLKNRDIVKSTALKILSDDINSVEVRIAAGNILIDSHPELIIKHIGSIFHE